MSSKTITPVSTLIFLQDVLGVRVVGCSWEEESLDDTFGESLDDPDDDDKEATEAAIGLLYSMEWISELNTVSLRTLHGC